MTQRILFVELEMEKNWSVASIGPAFLASAIRPLGHQVQIIHLKYDEDIQSSIEKIMAIHPDILALSLTSRQWLRAKFLCNSLRKQYRIPTIVGGLHPTFAADSVLKEPGIDFACLGEGEIAFMEFVQTIQSHPYHFQTQDHPLHHLKNIQYKNGPRPQLHPPFEPIDALPFMDRGMLNEQYGVIHMTTQRGCPFPCSYCAARMYNELYEADNSPERKINYGRRRSLENVFAELREIQQHGPLNYITFLDDTFTLNPKWIDDFCQQYPQEFAIPFSIHARVETINREMLHKLANAGCKHITYGVESGSERLRRQIMKRIVSNQRLIQAFEWSKEAGIITTANYILGSPTESIEDLEATLALHQQLDPHDFGYFIFYPYPGTPLFQYCKDHGLLPDDFEIRPANHRRSILNHDVLTPEELEQYYDKFTQIRQESYLRRYGMQLTTPQIDDVEKLYNDCADRG